MEGASFVRVVAGDRWSCEKICIIIRVHEMASSLDSFVVECDRTQEQESGEMDLLILEILAEKLNIVSVFRRESNSILAIYVRIV